MLRPRCTAAYVWLLLSLPLSGCGADEPPRGRPPPLVETIVLRPETIPNVIELPGRIQAARTAEVHARTDGIVQRRLFEEGADVAAGALLFQIDARDNQAQVQQARGTLQSALAELDNAASVVRRYEPLVAERAVSAQEFDAARSERAQAAARVTEARAALTRARLQLSYTTIRAPIAGRVGRAEVSEGALVSGSQATLMTRIDQSSPIYAVFTQSNADILNMVQGAEAGDIRLPAPSKVTVKLVLENGAEYPLPGQIDFTDASVDPATGSQTIRARFDNPQRLLAPGQFVRGRLSAGTNANGLVVPVRAVQLRGDQASVSVIAPDGTVVARPITLGAMLGDRWVVRSGLRPGEQVIVEGWQKARPGQKALVRPPAPAPAPGR